MAVTRTIEQLGADLRIGDGFRSTDRCGRSGAGAHRRDRPKVLVEAYASDAPVALQNEAYVRVAGYLYDSDPATGRGSPDALKASGAAARPGSLPQQAGRPDRQGNHLMPRGLSQPVTVPPPGGLRSFGHLSGHGDRLGPGSRTPEPLRTARAIRSMGSHSGSSPSATSRSWRTCKLPRARWDSST